VPARAIRIKVIDEDGRTVCVLRKTTHLDKQLRPEYSEPWGAEAKPLSEKALERHDASDRGRLSRPPVHTVDGQKYFKLPGLSLKWQKVESVLDQVAIALNLIDAAGAVLKDDMTAATLTIDQLRQFAQRF
jgi:hypothetical protein